jgi:hypothetical protein
VRGHSILAQHFVGCIARAELAWPLPGNDGMSDEQDTADAMRNGSVVAAVLLGGWLTGALASRFYDPERCGLGTLFPVFVLIPAGGIVSGLLVLLLTATSKKPIIAAILVVLGSILTLWLWPAL